MATKNRIAYALPIIQIIQILSDKFHKQMCLRLIYRERVGITPQSQQAPYYKAIESFATQMATFWQQYNIHSKKAAD